MNLSIPSISLLRRSTSTSSSSTTAPSSPSKTSKTVLAPNALTNEKIKAFTTYVPLRLNDRERSLLNILDSALIVSEYTDNVDIVSRRNKSQRIMDGIVEICATATGLGLCGVGSGLTAEMNNAAAKEEVRNNEGLYQEIFEVGRRNKILNPTKMRATYGKLMYIMQDAQCHTKSLGFSLHKELVMVNSFLNAKGALNLLDDELLPTAVSPVIEVDANTGKKLPRQDIVLSVQNKHQACQSLSEKYASADLSEDEIARVIDSISDAYTVVESNQAPVKRMLELLEENFDPSDPREKEQLSLELKSSGGSSIGGYRYGMGMGRFGFGGGSSSPSSPSSSSSASGCTLNHDHGMQYTFVWQTLKLWCEVQRSMHKLWVMADDDLLSMTNGYQLSNTGQGLNRIQSCPKVGRVMRNLLESVQRSAGASWVGLSVVHLGDRDVPNALVFIDKYTQVPRILQPIVDFVDGIEDFVSNPKIASYVDSTFQNRSLKMCVLLDYFKHGFDGSGDDGGSCIDGRLTSSWNWTSRIAKKRYHHAFLMSGFSGFDGDWK